jgi:hypothetical protein
MNELFGVETSDGSETYVFDASLAGTDAVVIAHDLNYIHYSQTLEHPSGPQTTVVTLTTDRVYENPT